MGRLKQLLFLLILVACQPIIVQPLLSNKQQNTPAAPAVSVSPAVLVQSSPTPIPSPSRPLVQVSVGNPNVNVRVGDTDIRIDTATPVPTVNPNPTSVPTIESCKNETPCSSVISSPPSIPTIAPSPTPSPTIAASPTTVPTATPNVTQAPTVTPSSTPTPTPTVTASPTPTASGTSSIYLVLENTGPSSFTSVGFGFDLPPIDAGQTLEFRVETGNSNDFKVGNSLLSSANPLPPGQKACAGPFQFPTGTQLEQDQITAGPGGYSLIMNAGYPAITVDQTVLSVDFNHAGVTGGKIKASLSFVSASPCN